MDDIFVSTIVLLHTSLSFTHNNRLISLSPKYSFVGNRIHIILPFVVKINKAKSFLSTRAKIHSYDLAFCATAVFSV